MKILLIHHNSHNLGDVAIAEATIAQVKKQFPDCEITLESNNPELSRRTFKYIKIVPRLFGISGIVHTKKIISVEFAIKNIPFILKTICALAASQIFVLFKLKFFCFPILSEYRKADLILSIAGDSISPDYAYFLRFYEINLIYRLKIPLILYAQSIGPFEGKMLKQAKKYLSKVSAIFARDKTTYNLMKEYGVQTKIYRTADTVISLQPRKNEKTKKVIQEYKVDSQTICIVLRVKRYTNYDKSEYIKYLEGMYKIVEEIKKKELKPLLIASISEDAEIGEKFVHKFNLNIKMLRLYNFLPSEVKTILKDAKMVISPRMHPIILSSSTGVPVIGQGREFKMRNYMKLIGMEEFFVDMIPMDLEKLKDLINNVLDNYEKVKAEINNKLPVAMSLSERNSEYLKIILQK